MNFVRAIKRHEELAATAALDGKAKLARAHLLRAGELRKARQIKKELRQ